MGSDRHLHRTMLAYVNQMFQQISGISVSYGCVLNMRKYGRNRLLICMQLITYYAATIYQNEIRLDSFTSRILAVANETGKVRSMPLLHSRSHGLRCV